MRKTIHNPAYQRLVGMLRATRLERGLRQEDVARRLGVVRTWLVKVEQHELRLDVVQLVRLARVYGLRPHRVIKELDEGLSDEDGPGPPIFLAIRRSWSQETRPVVTFPHFLNRAAAPPQPTTIAGHRQCTALTAKGARRRIIALDSSKFCQVHDPRRCKERLRSGTSRNA